MSSLTACKVNRIFKKLDRNNDDSVSLDELQWFLESMKLGSSSLDELECFAGKKHLNFAEFVYLCNTMCPHETNDSENDLLKSFEVFDKNRDGYISRDELRVVLSVLGLIDELDVMEVDKMIKAYDVNSDGLLDFNEFKKLML